MRTFLLTVFIFSMFHTAHSTDSLSLELVRLKKQVKYEQILREQKIAALTLDVESLHYVVSNMKASLDSIMLVELVLTDSLNNLNLALKELSTVIESNYKKQSREYVSLVTLLIIVLAGMIAIVLYWKRKQEDALKQIQKMIKNSTGDVIENIDHTRKTLKKRINKIEV